MQRHATRWDHFLRLKPRAPVAATPMMDRNAGTHYQCPRKYDHVGRWAGGKQHDGVHISLCWTVSKRREALQAGRRTLGSVGLRPDGLPYHFGVREQRY